MSCHPGIAISCVSDYKKISGVDAETIFSYLKKMLLKVSLFNFFFVMGSDPVCYTSTCVKET